jgi:hypothetical protein
MVHASLCTIKRTVFMLCVILSWSAGQNMLGLNECCRRYIFLRCVNEKLVIVAFNLLIYVTYVSFASCNEWHCNVSTFCALETIKSTAQLTRSCDPYFSVTQVNRCLVVRIILMKCVTVLTETVAVFFGPSSQMLLCLPKLGHYKSIPRPSEFITTLPSLRTTF